MPEVSRFFGIVIFMNYNDHLPPHFHAKYQEQFGEDSAAEVRRMYVSARD